MIREQGWVENGVASINMSSIYSRLIVLAGKYCENYASDILYDIKGIQEKIESGKDFETEVAFREMGCDGDAFIAIKGRDCKDYKQIVKVIGKRLMNYGYDAYEVRLVEED